MTLNRISFFKALIAAPFAAFAARFKAKERPKKVADRKPLGWKRPEIGDRMTVEGFGTGYVTHVGPDKDGFVDVIVSRWESEAASDDWSPAILARRRDLELRFAVP